MNTKILEYIIAIAEEKSISQAAERFYLSQPVLSRHLKKIEEELGTPLFVRGKPNLTLTDAGIIYINNAQAILHIEEELNRKLEEMRRKQKDSLRMLIDLPYLNFFLKRIFPRFREKYPDFHIEFVDTDMVSARRTLLDGKADLAMFATNVLNEEKLETVVLYTDELLLLLPQGDPAVLGLSRDVKNGKALRRHVFGLHPMNNTFRYMEDEWLAAIGVSPQTVLEVASFRNALEALYLRQCAAFLPKTRLNNADLSKLCPFSMNPPYHFYAVASYLKNAAFKKPVQELLQIMSEELIGFGEYITSLREKEHK